MVYPMPVDKVESIVLDGWAAAFEEAPLSLVAARFADLLWEARHGDRVHEWAMKAIDAYLQAAGGDFGLPTEISEGVKRAFRLASQINSSERRQKASDAALKFIRETLSGGGSRPGVVLPLLEMLTSLSPALRPSELVDLSERAIVEYEHDPWLLESAIDIRVKLVDDDERPALRAKAVEGIADHARRSEGIAKYASLHRAIELAEQYGLSGLAESLRREVSALSDDELDLKEIAVDIEMPRAQWERLPAPGEG